MSEEFTKPLTKQKAHPRFIEKTMECANLQDYTYEEYIAAAIREKNESIMKEREERYKKS